ncbi:MAG: metal-dependent transcriptional regulator [Acidobacteriota bacterium]
MAKSETGITASQEDYLEAILFICRDKPAARPSDLARRLSVSRASVTGALQNLAAHGLVRYARYDVVGLTKEGQAIAEQVASRHETLRKFLVSILGIEEKDADAAACVMEHGVKPAVLERLAAFVQFTERCPQAAGTRWSECVIAFNSPTSPDRCPVCLQRTLTHLKTEKRKSKKRSAGRSS